MKHNTSPPRKEEKNTAGIWSRCAGQLALHSLPFFDVDQYLTLRWLTWSLRSNEQETRLSNKAGKQISQSLGAPGMVYNYTSYTFATRNQHTTASISRLRSARRDPEKLPENVIGDSNPESRIPNPESRIPNSKSGPLRP